MVALYIDLVYLLLDLNRTVGRIIDLASVCAHFQGQQNLLMRTAHKDDQDDQNGPLDSETGRGCLESTLGSSLLNPRIQVAYALLAETLSCIFMCEQPFSTALFGVPFPSPHLEDSGLGN